MNLLECHSKRKLFPCCLKTDFLGSASTGSPSLSLLFPSFLILVCCCCITNCHKLNGVKQHMLKLSHTCYAPGVQAQVSCMPLQSCNQGVDQGVVLIWSLTGDQARSDCWQNSFPCSYRSEGWRPPSIPRRPSLLFAT